MNVFRYSFGTSQTVLLSRFSV